MKAGSYIFFYMYTVHGHTPCSGPGTSFLLQPAKMNTEERTVRLFGDTQPALVVSAGSRGMWYTQKAVVLSD